MPTHSTGGDTEALLQDFDSEAEFHSVLHEMLGREATVYRGLAGVRELVEDIYSNFSEGHAEYADIRDLGDRVFAIGRIQGVGAESGVTVDSPLAWIIEYRDAKAFRARS